MLGGRLVVVGDDARVLAALCRTLAENGYETQACATGAEALAVLQQTEVDVLLSDLMMPGIDGTTLLRAALEMVPDLVGIIMTGQGTIQTAVEAMRIGAFDYVLMPVTLSALLPVLSRTMEVHRLRAARRTLEAQVQEHTAILIHTNETLRHEIAERQRAEAALRREKEYFRALIEHATDIVGILNEDGTIRYFSPSLTRVLGHQPAELVGTPLTTFIHPDDLPGLQDTLPHCLSTPGAITHLEYRALHKDGAFRTLEVVGNNLLLNPAVAGIVINARDITERQEAARLKDDLLSVVSHELRTPLTSPRGFQLNCCSPARCPQINNSTS